MANNYRQPAQRRTMAATTIHRPLIETRPCIDRLSWNLTAMDHHFGVLRRFRFNRPQRIAALFLVLLLAQGLWVIARHPLTAPEVDSLRCGHALWAGGATTACPGTSDGLLDKQLAALAFEPDSLLARLLLRLPFLAASLLLGGSLWWVTRRLFGNRGGYLAIAFYCSSPAILALATTPNPEILAMLGLYSGVYTAIGVAHAMQGPRRKWRPRIVLLTLSLAVAAGAHRTALALALALGLGFMLWVAEGRRKPILPVLATAALGSLFLQWISLGFCWKKLSFSSVFSGISATMPPVRALFLSETGILLATCAALLFYGFSRRSRYFGNTTPLLCTLLCGALALLVKPEISWTWAIPFLLTFLAGIFADACEGAYARRAHALGTALVWVQILAGVSCAMFFC